MPKIYLSPSTQEFNPVNGGGNEEYYMNLIADAMEPFLLVSNIQFTRNTKDMTAASSIRASNSGKYDFHLALHSNASGSANSGNIRGSEAYYYKYSSSGKRAAQIFANNLKMIYPLPQNVKTVPTTTLGEVVKVKAPAVLIEYAYHDNEQDADWIKNNIQQIAINTVISLTDYFGIPFVPIYNVVTKTVTTSGDALNIRSEPNIHGKIIDSIKNGTKVDFFGSVGEWEVVNYNGKYGYVYKKYLK